MKRFALSLLGFGIGFGGMEAMRDVPNIHMLCFGIFASLIGILIWIGETMVQDRNANR